jgi:hypothetical protein
LETGLKLFLFEEEKLHKICNITNKFNHLIIIIAYQKVMHIFSYRTHSSRNFLKFQRIWFVTKIKYLNYSTHIE